MSNKNISLIPKISIVVPCYNEKDNIEALVKRFSEILKLPGKIGYRDDIEVVFVDNGSTDGSDFIFKSILKNYTFGVHHRININKGYGYGIKEGLKKANNEFVGWTHADLQTDPSDILRAVEIIKEEKCRKDIFIKGKRYGRKNSDKIFTFGMSVLESLLFCTKLVDINAQPSICHKDFISLAPEAPNDFSLDLYYFALARKLKFKIRRFDVYFGPRVHGNSSWNISWGSKFRFIVRTVTFSFKLLRFLNDQRMELKRMKTRNFILKNHDNN